MPDPIYFHGGMPGLNAGDVIVPGSPNFVDGCKICDAHKAGMSHEIDPLTVHADRVYITTDREYARFYASKYPRGGLYSVMPVGELTVSEEDHFPSWTVPEARVVGVYDRYVGLTTKQRRTLLNRWERADRQVAFARLTPPVQDTAPLADEPGAGKTSVEVNYDLPRSPEEETATDAAAEGIDPSSAWAASADTARTRTEATR